jgi:putative ATPase
MIFASEDIGMADPTSLQIAVAAAQALEMVGLPEARLNLAQATIHLALAPKSNAVITAIGKAQDDVRRGDIGRVPPHLRDAHYASAKKIAHGKGYRYPHDFPAGIVAQQYAPDVVHGREYYAPSDHGAERDAAARLTRIRDALRADPEEQTTR